MRFDLLLEYIHCIMDNRVSVRACLHVFETKVVYILCRKNFKSRGAERTVLSITSFLCREVVETRH